MTLPEVRAALDSGLYGATLESIHDVALGGRLGFVSWITGPGFVPWETDDNANRWAELDDAGLHHEVCAAYLQASLDAWESIRRPIGDVILAVQVHYPSAHETILTELRHRATILSIINPHEETPSSIVTSSGLDDALAIRPATIRVPPSIADNLESLEGRRVLVLFIEGARVLGSLTYVPRVDTAYRLSVVRAADASVGSGFAFTDGSEHPRLHHGF